MTVDFYSFILGICSNDSIILLILQPPKSNTHKSVHQIVPQEGLSYVRRGGGDRNLTILLLKMVAVKAISM
jgi:hypothetical protein